MVNFKIENFCSDSNSEFKKYYGYLNNPIYLSLLTKYLHNINHEDIKKKIYAMIKKNRKYVLERLKMIDTIIGYYEQNNLIEKSEIGKFFKFYKIQKKSTGISSVDSLFKLFYKLINYENCISVLKECFYIFSDYRACIYYMTPSINFHKTTKPTITKVVIAFRDNLNTLNQIISKIYIGDKNPFGNICYTSAYAMFETLLIMKQYFKDPLKMLKIKFTGKPINKNDLITSLCAKYNKVRLLQDNIDTKKIKNVSTFILTLKKLGYDMYFTIPLVFDTIYPKHVLKNIQESYVIGSKNIYHQKLNNKLGVMCFILTNNNYISSSNIFNNFND